MRCVTCKMVVLILVVGCARICIKNESCTVGGVAYRVFVRNEFELLKS